ncbi:hypothetical protein BH10ACI4_BH10ACI4_35810 [soil metagenome]
MKRLIFCSTLALALLAGCKHEVPDTELFNAEAALPANLPVQPWQWKVITSGIDPTQQTMSTLFGNDIAIASARTGAHTEYPAGAVLALVTWTQQEDRHWFGGRIPKAYKSMEVVKFIANPDGKNVSSYERFEGSGTTPVAIADEGRRESILSQRASVMP